MTVKNNYNKYIPIITDIATTSLPLINTIIHFIVRPYSDQLVEEKINEAKLQLRNKIINVSRDYYKEFYITVAIDAANLLFALFVYQILGITMLSINILSISIIIITIRFITKILKNILAILPHYSQIQLFLKDVINFQSLEAAFNNLILRNFHMFYFNNTTGIIRGIHTVSAKLGIVKSVHDMEKDVIYELISVIGEKSIKRNIYIVICLFLFYGSFSFFIKLAVFSHTVQMNNIELLLYPFKVLIPYFYKGGVFLH